MNDLMASKTLIEFIFTLIITDLWSNQITYARND